MRNLCFGSSRLFRFVFPCLVALILCLGIIGVACGMGEFDGSCPASFVFTQSRQTEDGQPWGQSQEWAWDYELTVINCPGFYYDGTSPNVLEMDIDRNFVHDSNPECFYGSVYGRPK